MKMYRVVCIDEYDDEVKIGNTTINKKYKLISVVFHPLRFREFVERVMEKASEEMIPYRILEEGSWENPSIDFICTTEDTSDMEDVLLKVQDDLRGAMEEEEGERKKDIYFGGGSLMGDQGGFYLPTSALTLPTEEMEEEEDNE